MSHRTAAGDALPDHESADRARLEAAVSGRYVVERELGRGGMGIVFLAADLALERRVAIKLLPVQLAFDETIRDRFLREARTVAALSHPNIVPIHAVEAHQDLVFFVMAYVDGESLGERVRRSGPIPAAAAARVMQDVAWALAYAHGRGIIHRDIKPDNILLDRASGRAVVADFGIAQALRAARPDSGVAGTPGYMSPEQALGEPADGRSDLFSLGVTTYFALTGKLPFHGPTAEATVLRLLDGRPTAVDMVAPGVPPALAGAVSRCLGREPGDRFGTGEELADHLRMAQLHAATPPEVRDMVRGLSTLAVGVAILPFAPYVLLSLAPPLWPADKKWLALIAVSLLWPAAKGAVDVIGAAQRVVAAGYDAADVVRGIEFAGRQRAEETLLRRPRSDGAIALKERWGRRMRILGHLGLAGMLGSFATLLGALLFGGDVPVPPLLVPLVASAAMIAGYGLGNRLKGEVDELQQAEVRTRGEITDPDAPRLIVSVVDRILRFAGRRTSGRLESLRTDAALAAAGITKDIDRAREVGAAVDAEVVARQDMERTSR